MGERFIYVFDPETRDKLAALGYICIKSDERNKLYVFLNDERLSFAKIDGCVTSDKLTF